MGARKASDAGKARAARLARILAENGIAVVSGLATGIDTAALESAVRNEGKVVAVIGTPIDECYPKDNAFLQSRIGLQHLLVSQVPFYRYSVQPFASKKVYFRERNVTMAAISDATVIVEASDTSGSLIQARACIKQGRPLFIMRSCLDNPDVTWPKRFVEAGAIVLEEPEALLERLARARATPVRQSITSISSANHRFLEKEDLCMYLMTRESHSARRTARPVLRGLPESGQSEDHALRPAREPLPFQAQGSGYRAVLERFCGLFAQSEASFVLVPAVTSKAESDPDLDDRIVRVCNAVAERLAQVRCEPGPSLKSSIPSASRSYGRRDPDLIRSYIRGEPLRDLSCDFVLIVDDVISSGAHFKACQRAVFDAYGVKAGGAFWARAESPLEQRGL